MRKSVAVIEGNTRVGIGMIGMIGCASRDCLAWLKSRHDTSEA